MSFSDMMSSGRGPGVIGMVLALIVLLGFGVLFMFAFDEGFQGGGQTIESVIAEQAKEIDGYKQRITKDQQELGVAPARLAAADALSLAKRGHKAADERIEASRRKVEAGKADLAAAEKALADYKDEYRAFVRGKAKGTTLPELRTKAGAVYKNVSIREVTAVGIQIRHDEGHKRIGFEELSDELQDYYQYDPSQKESALAAESADRQKHEADVTAANEAADAQMAVQREIDAKKNKANLQREIAQKEAMVKSLEQEIEQLTEAIKLESKKKLSRAGIMNEQLVDKQRNLSALRSQIGSLRSRLQ